MIQYILIFLFVFTSCENIYLGKNLKFQLGQLKLPEIFSDGMVLQRDTTVAIWGQSKPNKLVTITSSWGYKVSTTSNQDGKWQTVLKTKKDPGPYSLEVKTGLNSIQINDILMGEVWLAAGQSNMEMTFDYCCNTTDNSEVEIATADYPHIRMFNVKKNLSLKPLETLKGNWHSAVGKGIVNFSAVGYYFAKKLHQSLNVPIGIIHASWGGSRAEAWTSHDVFNNLKQYEKELSDLDQIYNENKIAREWFSKFESIPLASGAFDLTLSEILPAVGYLDYFIDDWKKLDHLGKDEIINTTSGEQWIELDSTNLVDEIFGTTNFRGAALFKNEFIVGDKKNDYFIEINPEKDIPWGLWEYDIFINGNKVGSSLLDLGGEKYKFYKSVKKYDIGAAHLKPGNNQIIIRVLGYARVGDISLRNSKILNIKLSSNWKCKILAEEFFQIDNYQYPYTSLYMYENMGVDLSKIPPKTVINHHTIGSLYNGMINPIIPYGIKGIIWYQGETNVEKGGPEFENYRTLIPMMIDDWRTRWGYEVPFYYAQIAPYFNYNGMLPYLRAAQNSFLKIPKTGMIVTLDIGENFDIHPSNKHDVGYRFARLALKRLYGGDQIESGPLFDRFSVKGSNIYVYFNYTGSGLSLKGSDKTWFELAGEDRVYYDASVINHNNHLELFSNSVIDPKYIRYAWSDTATATLFNLDGLPGSPFSSEYD